MQNYNRQVIDMKIDERGFTTQSKGPAGYCKLETRGKKSRIKVNVHGLVKSDKVYRAQLIKTEDEQTKVINLGVLHMDQQNNGTFNISLDSDNVLGSGIPIDDFALIAIASLDNRRHPIFPLVGRIKEGNPNWKQYVHTEGSPYENIDEIPYKEETSIICPKVPANHSKQEVSPVNHKQEVEEAKQEMQEEPQDTHETPSYETEVASKEHNQKASSKEYDNRYNHNRNEEKEEPVYYSDHTYEAKKSIEINDMGNQTFDIIKKHFDPNELDQIHKNIFANYPPMNPFERVDEDKEWVRIEPADIIYFPMDTWMLTNNTFLLNGYRRYKHLILGRNKVTCHEKPHFYLGVPGIYYPKDRVAAYFYGFKDFICCADTGTKAGEYGYWIVEIEG